MSTFTYKNARQEVGTSYTTIYTCPGATTAHILLAQCANVDGVNSADASLQWLDSSAANAATRLAKAVAVAPATAIGMLSGTLVLEAGDVIQALASATGDLEMSMSILEIS